MAKAIDAVIFMVCLNIAVWMLGQAGVTPLIGVAGFNPQTFAVTIIGVAAIAIGAAVTGGSNSLVYMFIAWAAIGAMFTEIRTIITGFPDFLLSIGAPTFIVYSLEGLWVFLIFLWVLHMVTGRDIL